MIVSRFPYPLEKGDKLRAFYQLKELSKYYDVTLVALSTKAVTDEQKKQVSIYCDEMHICRLNSFFQWINLALSFFNSKPFQIGYFYSYKVQNLIKSLVKDNNYKHIYSQLVRTSEYSKNIHSIPKTLDYMDALSIGIKRRISKQPIFKRWIFKSEAKRLANYEQSIFDYFENKTIISEQDKNLIRHPDRDQIVCIPNGIDNSFFEPNVSTPEYDFVFVGNMSYPPNIEAVQYIVKSILPAFPDKTLLISGSAPHASVMAIAARNKNVTVTGWIEDIRSAYSKGRIFLAPMFIGTGMQNKLLEAMAMKVPCVTTPLANNAIKAREGIDIMVGENEIEIVTAITMLLNDEAFRTRLANAGSEFVKDNYSWEESVADLVKIIEK